MLKSIRKSKNRYFYHIFVSPGDAPGAITLSVVWMEKEFNAYKLSRCMCPSDYNHFWDIARNLWKIVILSYPLIVPLAFDAPVRGVPVGISPPRLVLKKKNGGATRRQKEIYICNGLDTIPACDRRTDILPRHIRAVKMVKTELYLLWQTDRKSYMIYHILPFSLTLNDPNADFKCIQAGYANLFFLKFDIITLTCDFSVFWLYMTFQ